MKIPQSSTRTRRLRARAKKHQISSSPRRRRRRRTHERREFKRFFLSREQKREDEKEEKQRDKERFSSLTERGENHSFSSSAIRVSIPRAITAAASVAARAYSFVVCNRACVSRASERVYRHHYSLYIRSFCVLSPRFCCCLGVKNFSLSLFLFLRNDRQTDTHSATTRVREIHDEREVKVLRALLFSFLSSQKRYESFVS